MAVSLGLRGIKYVIPSRLLRRGSVARAKVSLFSARLQLSTMFVT